MKCSIQLGMQYRLKGNNTRKSYNHVTGHCNNGYARFALDLGASVIIFSSNSTMLIKAFAVLHSMFLCIRLTSMILYFLRIQIPE